jgi:hypothetical protein
MNSRRGLVVAVGVALLVVGSMAAFGANAMLAPDSALDGVDGQPAVDTTTTPKQTDERAIAYDGDRLTLANDPNRTVRGTTDLASGTQLQVVLQSTGPGTQFIKTTSTTIGEDGSYEAAFDMSGIDPDTRVRVELRHDGARLANTTGTVVAGSVPEDTATKDDSSVLSSEGDAITLKNTGDQTVQGTTNLTAGSEVSVRLQNNGDGTKFLKVATATVDDGGHFEVTFNMTGINTDSTFDVTVVHDEEVLAEASGEVTETEG